MSPYFSNEFYETMHTQTFALALVLATVLNTNLAYVVVQKSNGNLWLIVPNRRLVTQLALNDEAFSSNLGDVFGGGHMPVASRTSQNNPDYERWILSKRRDDEFKSKMDHE